MATSSKGANNAPSDKELARVGGPWQPLQTPLKNTISRARSISFDPWEYGPGVVEGFNDTQNAGLDTGIATASGALPGLRTASDYATGIAGGSEVGRGPAQGVFDSVAGGVTNPSAAEYGAIRSEAMGGSGGMEYLRGAARGDNLQDNPYLEKQIAAASRGVTDEFKRTVMPGIEGRMSMNGRLGSPVETDLKGAAYDRLAQSLGEIESGFRGNAYESERGRQQQAALALPGAQATEIATKTGAAKTVADDAYTRLSMQLDAAGKSADNRRADVNQALAANNSAGTAYNTAQQASKDMFAAGSERQAQQERVNQENQDQFRYNQEEPYNRLTRLLQQYGMIGGLTNPGAAANYYTQSQSGPSGTEVAIGNTLGAVGAGAKAGALFV